MLAHKNQQGKVDILNLLGLVFLVVTLAVSTSIVANPDIRQIFSSDASGGRVRNCEDLGDPKKRQACRKAQDEAEDKVQPAATPTGDITLNQLTGNTSNNAFVSPEDQVNSNILTNFLATFKKDENDDAQTTTNQTEIVVPVTTTQESQTIVGPAPVPQTTTSTSDLTLNQFTGQSTGTNVFVDPNQTEINKQIDQRLGETQLTSLAQNTTDPFANVTAQAGAALDTTTPSYLQAAVGQDGGISPEGGNTYKPTFLENLYTDLNQISIGAFGYYVQTYEDINSNNPDVENNLLSSDYYEKAFDPKGVFATGVFITNTLTQEAGQALLIGRDIFTENAKYKLSQLNIFNEDTFYLAGPGANKNVYEKNGIIYDSTTNQPLGEISQFSGGNYSYLSEPNTVFVNNISQGIYQYADQHSTITQETFESQKLQDVMQEVNTQLGESNLNDSLATINTVNSIINNDIPYYQPLIWTGTDNVDPNTKVVSTLSYAIQYRTLDNLVNNDYTICFEKSVTEHIVLAQQGIDSQIVYNPKLSHVYLIVNIDGSDYVVDPTKGDGTVRPIAEHMDIYSYEEGELIPIDSPLTDFQ